MSNLSRVAREIQSNMGVDPVVKEPVVPQTASLVEHFPKSAFSYKSAIIAQSIGANTVENPVVRDSDWQRVNSLIADVLKDSSVLYAKLARLQGDFVGEHLVQLEEIGGQVRSIADELSVFSKEFTKGDVEMAPSQTPFGVQGQSPQVMVEEAPESDSGEGESDDGSGDSDSDFDLEAEIVDYDVSVESDEDEDEDEDDEG